MLLNKEINQTFVYIFVDKFLDLKDKESYLEVKKLLKRYQSKFENIEIIYNKENKGLARNITEGINFVFKKNEKIIVLEDDIEVAGSFLSYMNKALDKYKNKKSLAYFRLYSTF